MLNSTKKMFAVLLSASMLTAAVPVLADTASALSTAPIIIGSESVSYPGISDNNSGAELFSVNTLSDNESECLTHLSAELDKATGDTCTVQLAQFGLSADATHIANDIFINLPNKYPISHIKAFTSNGTLTAVTFSLNTMTEEEAINIIAEKAKNEIDYNTHTVKISDIPLSILMSENFLSKIQAAAPELCYLTTRRGNLITLGSSIIITDNFFEYDISTPSGEILCLDISQEQYAAFEKKLDDIIKETITPKMTTEDKVLALHDWIVNNVSYGYKVDIDFLDKYIAEDFDKTNLDDSIIIYDVTSASSDFEQLKKIVSDEDRAVLESKHWKAHTAYAAAMEGHAVCQGYSMLYSALLDKLGIDNGTVINNDIDHQWSLVNLGDDNSPEWYHTDVTWDDPSLYMIDATYNPAEDVTPDYIKEHSSNISKIPLRSENGSITDDVFYFTSDSISYDYYMRSTDDFTGSVLDLLYYGNKHFADEEGYSQGLYIPADAQCTSQEYTVVSEETVPVELINDSVIDVNIAKYVTGTNTHESYDIRQYNLFYNKDTEKYYYIVDYVSADNYLHATKYYESPLCRITENGELIAPKEIYSYTFDELGTKASLDEFKEFVKKYVEDHSDEYDNEFPTVQIPNDELVINNTPLNIKAEFAVNGENEESLTVENIDTVSIMLTPSEEADKAPIEKVDAYLVYYGEENVMLKASLQHVNISTVGTIINFEQENAPDGATAAKIILLNANSELTPIIKAIGTF